MRDSEGSIKKIELCVARVFVSMGFVLLFIMNIGFISWNQAQVL